MGVKTFDPAAWQFIFANRIFTGYAPGSIIVAERKDPVDYETHVGTTGEVCRVRKRNRAGTFTIRLMATSADNDILSNARRAGELTPGSVFPALLKNTLGRGNHSGANAWVEEAPTETIQDGEPVLEWKIAVDVMDMTHGGAI